MLSSGSSLNIDTNFLMVSTNYCYILLAFTLALQHQDPWYYLLWCYLF